MKAGVRCLFVLGIATGVMAAASAEATDTPIPGLKIKIADATQPGLAHRKIIFVSKDPAIPLPADGSAGDPSLNGGSLRVVNTAGSGESQLLALGAGNWHRIPGDPSDPLRGWKYKEVVSTPPSFDYKIKVVLKQTLSGVVLRALVKDDRGSVISYTLDEPTQGSVGVQVSTGSDRTCADFGGTIVEDASTDLGGDVYRGAFLAKLAPPPPSCASPGGAFID